MSMQSTQKPRPFHPIRPQSAEPLHRNIQSSSQKNMRMSIIDQLSPIRELGVSRSSFYQVKAKGATNPQLVSTRTNPSKLGESCSFATSLNYTHDSMMENRMKNATIPKGMRILSSGDTLRDQFRFCICQLEDLRYQSDRQQLFDQLINVLKQLQNQTCTFMQEYQNLKSNQEYEKLKSILEQLQGKTSYVVNENAKLTQQIKYLEDEKNSFALKLSESEQRVRNLYQQLQQDKENKSNIVNQQYKNGNSSNYSQRELTYKLEQAELKLLTLQISNDNLKKQLEHSKLDMHNIENLKETINTLETKSLDLLNSRDSYQQENDLLYTKVRNLEKQLQDQTNNRSYQEQINQLQSELQIAGSTRQSLNNTINQLMEQVKLLQNQNLEQDSQIKQQNIALQNGNSKYQKLLQEVMEIRSRIDDSHIQFQGRSMINQAEKQQYEAKILNYCDKVRELDDKINELEQQLENERKYKQQIELRLQTESNDKRFETQLIAKQRDCIQLQDELNQIRNYYEQCLQKNQNLEMRLLYYLEQEIKQNVN